MGKGPDELTSTTAPSPALMLPAGQKQWYAAGGGGRKEATLPGSRLLKLQRNSHHSPQWRTLFMFH